MASHERLRWSKESLKTWHTSKIRHASYGRVSFGTACSSALVLVAQGGNKPSVRHISQNQRNPYSRS